MRVSGLLVAAAALYACTAFAQNYPSDHISNGVITVDLYLPDPKSGSYRATRFDWSGIIRSLTYKEHSYFGQWYENHDPLIHDAITGPVNIFNDATGYAEAKPGQTFVRIGVGRLEKPDDQPYRETNTYKVIDPGKWSVHNGGNSIQFTQELTDETYGYVYTKTITLPPGNPRMKLAQELRNTGSKTIDTLVFNHGFFQIDREPAGPGLLWTFPFEPRTARDFSGMAEIRAKQIAYLREIKSGERVLAPIEGYSDSPEDHGFTVENRKTGAGVRVSGDRPMVKLNFWSRRMAYSPEASIHLHIPPGQTGRWETKYEFYIASAKDRAN